MPRAKIAIAPIEAARRECRASPTSRQAQVVASLLGMHPSTVYRLSSRFLKDPDGYAHDL